MRSQLLVIHRPRGQGQEEASFKLDSKWVEWETCIRRLAIGSLEAEDSVKLALQNDDVIYKGVRAYRFLLEVVCGLQSPVKGETEVHGQFRDVLEKLGVSHPLYKILNEVHLEARKVRASHLQGLGSQSYGSLARRKAREAKEAHILGAGKLTREILPWLSKLSIPVNVYVRDVGKHKDLTEKYHTVKVRELNELASFHSGVLIVAAPLSSGFILDWLAERSTHIQAVLDYRGESHSDPLRLSTTYLSLQDIFREIDNTKQKVDAKVESAKQMIQSFCV